VALIAAAIAIGQDVTSVNAVGFNKITIGPGKLALVTLNFESFGDSTLEDLIGHQLVRGKVYVWNRVAKEYIPASIGKDGKWSYTNIIHRGDAFWIKNEDTATNSVSFMGEVPYTYNNSATATVYNLSGVEAVGYAYPVDMTWTNTTLSKESTVKTMYYYNETAGGYDIYSRGKTGWNTPNAFAIPAGRAFWIKLSDGASVDWTEVAPYSL